MGNGPDSLVAGSRPCQARASGLRVRIGLVAQVLCYPIVTSLRPYSMLVVLSPLAHTLFFFLLQPQQQVCTTLSWITSHLPLAHRTIQVKKSSRPGDAALGLSLHRRAITAAFPPLGRFPCKTPANDATLEHACFRNDQASYCCSNRSYNCCAAATPFHWDSPLLPAYCPSSGAHAFKRVFACFLHEIVDKCRLSKRRTWSRSSRSSRSKSCSMNRQ